MESHSPKVSEADQRCIVFSMDSIETALNFDCCRSKESYRCPNDFKCKDIFTRSEGPEKISELRKLIWLRNMSGSNAPSTGARRNNFVELLRSMNRTTDNKIIFCISGKYVCKSFFKVSINLIS
jgi:hypothetical protein